MVVKIDDLLRDATVCGASDLHIKAGSFPVMRVDGELKHVTNSSRLTQDDTLDMAFSIMSNRQKQRFKETSEVDIAYGLSGVGRFRANVFQQRGTVSMVLRVIPDRVRTMSDLGLPPAVEQIAPVGEGLLVPRPH